VSIITRQAATPYPVTTVTTGFNTPFGILYAGAHIWVADAGAHPANRNGRINFWVTLSGTTNVLPL
jgi:hypothetical protein